MANPFEDTLEEVVVYTGSTLVSLETLKDLQGYLSNQENKIIALTRGLAQSLIGHYDKARGDRTLDDVRAAVVQMLTSLALLAKGRVVLLKSPIGKDKLLKYLNDPSPNVRKGACNLFSTLAVFPDVHHVLLQGRTVINALVKVLLNDELFVSKETLPGLAQLSTQDSATTEAVMKRLLQLLKDEPPLHQDVLQTLWNCCKEEKEKELAIACNAIPILASLLDVKDVQTRRAVAGCLMAVTVPKNGKIGLIQEDDALTLLVQYSCGDGSTPKELRTNSCYAIRNVVEHPEGLRKLGNLLLKDPQVMLEILSEEQTASVLNSGLDLKEESTSTPELKEHLTATLTALVLLCKTSAGREAAWSILEVIPRLHAIVAAQQQTSKVRGLAKKAIEALCMENEDAKAIFDALPRDKDEEYVATANSTITPAECAIVLIQYQNDYLSTKGKLFAAVEECAEETQLLWHTVDLVEKARKLGVTIIHIPLEFTGGKYEGGPLGDMAAAKAFVPNTWGSDIVDELNPESEDAIVKTSSLNAFEATDLESILRKRGISDLAVCGSLGEAAVETTMRAAYDRGFRVFAIGDCIASSSMETQKALLENSLPSFGLHIVKYKKLLALLTSESSLK